MHHSPYLEIRGRTYGFRARIPTDLRRAYGRKTEIRHTLRTKDKAEAVRLCRMRSLEVDAEFAQKRRQLLQAAAPQIDRVATLTEEDVKRICTLWTHCVLDSDERTREAGIDDAEFDEMAEQFGANAAELRAALARGRVEIVEQALKGFLFLVGVEVDAASPGYRRLAYAFLQTVTQTLEFQQQRHAGAVVRMEDVAPEKEAFRPGSAPGSTVGFDEVFDLWKSAVDGRAESTVRTYRQALNELATFLKHRDAARVTREDLERYVTDAQDVQKAHFRTLKKKVGCICSIFNRAVRKKRLTVNPAAQIEVRRPARPKKPRVPYEGHELKAIFASPVFAQGKRPKAAGGEAAVWLPVLGYYTGARLEELGQLKVDDLQRDDELGWYINIVDQDDDQDLKTEASRRRIPVAQALIDLGLLRYRDAIAARGVVFLFPDLQADCKGVRTGNWSKWWGRYARQTVGISDRRKTFYSLRHGFKDLCRDAILDGDVHRALTGHTRGRDASDGYGGELYPLRPLVDGVQRLRFADFGLAPLYPRGAKGVGSS